LSAVAGGWPSGLAVAPKVASAPRGPIPATLAGNLVQSLPRAGWQNWARWTNFDQSISFRIFGHYLTKMNVELKTISFGENLRNLRERSGFTLKTVAEQIQIDISLLAKIERNERPPNKHIIKLFANFFKVDEKQLQTDFLSDLIAYKIIDENADLHVLKVAEAKVNYLKNINDGN
jgi:transcriptional regulator with XRE-family HTH domain